MKRIFDIFHSKRIFNIFRYLYLCLPLLALLACSGPESIGSQRETVTEVQANKTPLTVLADALTKKGYTLNWDDKFTVGDVSVVPLTEVAGQVLYLNQNGVVTDARLTLLDVPSNQRGKWPVCHVPPGNPSNAHTIFVGYPAIKAHEKHGDAADFCPSDAATIEGAGRTTLLVYEVDGDIYAYYAKIGYGASGPVILEQGDSLGTGSFEELTTVGSPLDLSDEEPSTWYNDLVEQLTEDLGDDAEDILNPSSNTSRLSGTRLSVNGEAIPTSLGGDMPNIITECGENGSECSDPDPEPDPGDDGDPDAGTPEGGEDNGGSEPGSNPSDTDNEGADGDDGDEGGSGDDGPQEGDPGPSYDEDELARLEGEVERVEGEIVRQNELIERTEQTVELFEQKAEDAFAESKRLFHEEYEVPELRERLEEVEETLEEAKDEYQRDTLFVQIVELLVSPICTKSKTACAGDTFGYAETTRGRIRTAAEIFELREERDAINAQGAKALEEIATQSSLFEGYSEAAELQSANLVRYDVELEELEQDLVVAEDNLETFKNQNNIP